MTTEPDDPRIEILEGEIEAMWTASRAQEEMIAEGYAQMDLMLQDLERKAEEASRASEESAAARAVLDRILNTMSEVLIVIGNDGLVHDVNARFSKLTGLSKDRIVGQPPEHFFVHEQLQALAHKHGLELHPEHPAASLFGDPRCAKLHGSLVSASGEEFAHIFRFGVLRNTQGKKEGIVVVGSDVRELQQTLNSLAKAHEGMRLVLDNIDQGLLTVDRGGHISPEYSAKVNEWFGEIYGGELLWDLFDRFQPGVGLRLELAFEQLVEGFLPLELCLAQMPRNLTQEGQTLEIKFDCVFDDDVIQTILVIVSDVSAQIAAAKAEAERKEFLSIVERIVVDRDFFMQFFNDACRIVDQLERTTDTAVQFRLIHTLKGNAAAFSIHSVAMACHEIESRLVQEGGNLTPAEFDSLHAAWDTTVANVGRLLADAGTSISISQHAYQELLNELRRRPDLKDISSKVECWQHPTVEVLLKQLSGQCQRLAQQLEKEVQVEVDCDDSRLPREGWGSLWSNLVHAVRNALDHGIEPPAVRRTLGKPPVGRLWLAARTTPEGFTITVADDGAGINEEKVRIRARQLGVLDGDAQVSLSTLLFADGLSTKDEVSTISGRGVGLAALREAIEQLHGRIDVHTSPGAGTTMRFSFPEPRREPPREERRIQANAPLS